MLRQQRAKLCCFVPELGCVGEVLELAATARAKVRALRLGAVRAADQPAPDRYIVLTDPAGHPFCLSTQIPE